jgi:hypothetical protein
MRGTKAKAIRRAIENTYQVGAKAINYSIGTKWPYKGMIIHSPGTFYALYRPFKRAYKRDAMAHLGRLT